MKYESVKEDNFLITTICDYDNNEYSMFLFYGDHYDLHYEIKFKENLDMFENLEFCSASELNLLSILFSRFKEKNLKLFNNFFYYNIFL